MIGRFRPRDASRPQSPYVRDAEEDFAASNADERSQEDSWTEIGFRLWDQKEKCFEIIQKHERLDSNHERSYILTIGSTVQITTQLTML